MIGCQDDVSALKLVEGYPPAFAVILVASQAAIYHVPTTLSVFSIQMECQHKLEKLLLPGTYHWEILVQFRLFVQQRGLTRRWYNNECSRNLWMQRPTNIVIGAFVVQVCCH